ncbi:hypothetical protein QP324_04145 [Corynebacterium sp. UMB0012]|uniref:hypothetical protein n=1 Tax=Corynebacterium sp. UMB0012 TaxID=3046344 RepID=UPI00254C0BCB|nr:hypothetical protein [Corynebacterium sp. UMB0012]MDK7047766.1 hypothetical protein [Corynebacterium sp. UMB0012]
MRQITHAEAVNHLKDIETRLKLIYRYTHVSENIRRQIKDAAAHTHLISAKITAYERKTRHANHQSK